MLPQLGGNRASGNLGGGFRPAEGMASNGMVYNPAVENMYRGNLGGTAPVYPANTPAIHDRNVIQNAADAIHPPISMGFGHAAATPSVHEQLQNLLHRIQVGGRRAGNAGGRHPLSDLLMALGG